MAEHTMQTAHWLTVTLYSIGDAVIATDNESRITFMNPVAEALTGWTSKEAEGVSLETVFRIVNEETRRTVESPVARALREGIVVGLANHTLLIARDGTEKPIDDSAAPIRDDAGQVAGVVLVFRDITERKHFEQGLRDALEYASNILATVRESLLVLDTNLRVVTANGAFYQTFNVAPEDTEGRFVYELGHGQWNIPPLRTLLEDVLPQNHSFDNFEVEHEFPDVGRKIMLLNARRVRKPGNRSELILLAIEDATERLLAERRAKESERRYRRLFESARDGILILDSESMRIVDSNPFMHDLLGYSREQLTGKELWEIGLFQDKSESQAAMRQLRKEGYVRYEELPLETGRGEVRDVEFIGISYEVDGREVFQCNVRDITERVERQIQAKIRELADANRRKDEFLAMLSHELRNPLAPIFNALSLIGQNGYENEFQREASGIIGRQVRHLSRLVDDLLEVSRITTGRIRLHVERVDVNGIVERAIERLRPDIDRRRQELAVTPADKPFWLDADSTRLEQVVGNLLNNASKYSDHGGHIQLTVEPQDDQVLIRVRDDGIGMVSELLPDIFDLFTQADKSLDRTQGGLGIGLALVKSLVELHRGSVEAHSEGIGRGSEFVVRLPIAADLETPPFPAVQPATAAGPQRILVVDDNVDAARVCAMLLRSWGYEVRTAYNGPDGLQRAIGFHPHVILLDIGLPEMDGNEVARHVRRDQQLKHVHLVAVTGYGQDTDKLRSGEAGFDDHLVKPVESTDLKELLAGIQLRS